MAIEEFQMLCTNVNYMKAFAAPRQSIHTISSKAELNLITGRGVTISKSRWEFNLKSQVGRILVQNPLDLA